MKKELIEEIAQWVISNRYPKGEYDKVTDFEMHHTIIDKIQALQQRESDIQEWVKNNLYNYSIEYYDEGGYQGIDERELVKLLQDFANNKPLPTPPNK